MSIEYRLLAGHECERMKEINPARFIKRAWRSVDGVKQWINITTVSGRKNAKLKFVQTRGYILRACPKSPRQRLFGQFSATLRRHFLACLMGKRRQHLLDL